MDRVDSRDVLRRLFGEDFVKEYERIKEESSRISEEIVQEALKRAFIDMPRHKEDHLITYDVQGRKIDVVLAFTPFSDNLREVKQTSTGRPKVVMIWHGAVRKGASRPYLFVYLHQGEDEKAKRLTMNPEEPFLLAGRLKKSTGNTGDTLFRFYLEGYISLVEYVPEEPKEFKEVVE